MTPEDRIAHRIAAVLRPGECVNLGVGLPGRVLDHLPAGSGVCLQSETGLLNYELRESRALAGDWRLLGEYIDANGNVAVLRPGGAVLDLVDSFGLMRSGRVDTAVLGAYQVDAMGRLASWSRGLGHETGMGGAMDLLAGARRVIAALRHTDRSGRSKIVRQLTLPPTGERRVDLVVTELGVMEVTARGLILRELEDGVQLEQVLASTDAPLDVGLRPRASSRAEGGS
jgi:3-oxoacid CoA-transferase B subunit